MARSHDATPARMSFLARCLAWMGYSMAAGPRGERLAARHLRRQRYRILGRNLRGRVGEIDLLAQTPDGRTIVIVEVKAGRLGGIRPEHHVNSAKQRKLSHLAAALVRERRLGDRPVRFDVMAVEFSPRGGAVVRHHIGAFESVL